MMRRIRDAWLVLTGRACIIRRELPNGTVTTTLRDWPSGGVTISGQFTCPPGTYITWNGA